MGRICGQNSRVEREDLGKGRYHIFLGNFSVEKDAELFQSQMEQSSGGHRLGEKPRKLLAEQVLTAGSTSQEGNADKSLQQNSESCWVTSSKILDPQEEERGSPAHH